MRYYSFLVFVGIALFLDLVLFGLSLSQPGRRLQFGGAPVALAAHTAAGQPAPTPPARPTALPRTSTPTATPLPTATPSPTPSPQPTSTPANTPTATATPEPPQIVAAGSAAFSPHNPAVKANIRLALSHYNGALTHVVVAPGGLFSFNAALGRDPERLPWKNVVAEQPTAAPDPAASDGSAPAAPLVATRVRGGGLCDLASRYVMAARPLLPNRAFRFVNHVRSTGIYLNGVPVRDSVSIWAVGGRAGEQDLQITNVTKYWLEFVVERNQERITVRARLWDGIPPSW